MNTGRHYTDGTPISVGDTIIDENGCSGIVFEYKWKYRVAARQSDLSNGVSASLGLFIVGGIYKSNNGTETLQDQPS